MRHWLTVGTMIVALVGSVIVAVSCLALVVYLLIHVF
jgi:hypothetical protein